MIPIEQYTSALNEMRAETGLFSYYGVLARYAAMGLPKPGPATASLFFRASALGGDPCDDWGLYVTNGDWT